MTDIIERIGETLGDKLPEGYGYCVIIMNENGIGDMVSNVNEPSLIKHLVGLAQKLEKEGK